MAVVKDTSEDTHPTSFGSGAFFIASTVAATGWTPLA